MLSCFLFPSDETRCKRTPQQRWTFTLMYQRRERPPRVSIGLLLLVLIALSCLVPAQSNYIVNEGLVSRMAQTMYETVLFDMDGVLAEVSKSYRAAIILTCKHYGASSVTDETVTEWKVRGNANNDWVLSRDLILADPNGNKDVTLEEVTETFEDFYQGKGETPGLYKLETLLPTRELLLELRKRSRGGMGIVTGRPRSDCMKFLKDMDLMDLFNAYFCAGEGPSKPDPFGVKKVCQDLGVEPSKKVVLIGDTPDDIRAAVAAGCSGVGVTTPEAVASQESKGQSHTEAPLSKAMIECGADMVLPPGFGELLNHFAAASSES